MRKVWVNKKGDRLHTFQEIGEHLGVSGGRVQHLHAKLIKKLQNKLVEEPLIRDWLIDNGIDVDETAT